MSNFIYLDNNATTAVDPVVLQAMLPFFSESYGNASSTNHILGKKAANAVNQAREQVAELIHAEAREITFTSGATEAINLVIKGVLKRYESVGKHIITCRTEHKAVLEVCRVMEKEGGQVTYLNVDAQGHINIQDLEAAIRKDTVLIVLMYANNETGVLHPVHEIADIAQKNKVLFFCDATQAVGKVAVSVNSLPVDLMAFSAHKINGPKGIGALYIRRKTRRIQLEPLISGGGHENGIRGGTLNVPGIVGFGAACRLWKEAHLTESSRLQELRDRLEGELLKIEESYLNGSTDNRLKQVTNICFRFVKAEELMVAIGTIAMSSGSACSVGALEPSHVLSAMGISKEDARASLRLSLGKFNTLQEIDLAIQLITAKVNELRQRSPAWQLFKMGVID